MALWTCLRTLTSYMKFRFLTLVFIQEKVPVKGTFSMLYSGGCHQLVERVVLELLSLPSLSLPLWLLRSSSILPKRKVMPAEM